MKQNAFNFGFSSRIGVGNESKNDDCFVAQASTSLDKKAGKTRMRRTRFSFDGFLSGSPRNDEADDYNLYRQRLMQDERTYNQECAICQETFEKTDLVCQLPCHIKHIFHATCVKAWISRQNACPLCKEKIPIEESELPEEHQRGAQVRDDDWVFAHGPMY